MIQSSDLIDWPKVLLVEFDYRYYRFNQIFGYRLKALIISHTFIFVDVQVDVGRYLKSKPNINEGVCLVIGDRDSTPQNWPKFLSQLFCFLPNQDTHPEKKERPKLQTGKLQVITPIVLTPPQKASLILPVGIQILGSVYQDRVWVTFERGGYTLPLM